MKALLSVWLTLLGHRTWRAEALPHQRCGLTILRGGSTHESVELLLVNDWTELAGFARSAALTYYDFGTILSAHERWWYERQADSVTWAVDGNGIEARWGRTKRGEHCTLVIRELADAGMRYMVRTERKDGIARHHVAIKGSDNAQNFRDDVDYAKVIDRVCRARLHRGFKRLADAVWDDAAEYLERDAHFELTGHSMGGGVATILGMRLVASGATVSRVISFGAPKITNAHGVKTYATRLPLLRVLTADDPVPTLPSMDAASQIFGFYRHFGHRLLLVDDNEDDDDDDRRLTTTVYLSPRDHSGVARPRDITVGVGRYVWRPDPRWRPPSSGAGRFVNLLDTNDWRSLFSRLGSRALRHLVTWHLDESFFFHAHHVSATAHSMDAYESHIQTRAIHAKPVSHYRRTEAPKQALRKRAPFLLLTSLFAHRAWKWRRVLKLVKPRYLIMSLLFVGWTGAGQSRALFEDDHNDNDVQHRPSSFPPERDLPPVPNDEDRPDIYRPSYRSAHVLRTSPAFSRGGAARPVVELTAPSQSASHTRHPPGSTASHAFDP